MRSSLTALITGIVLTAASAVPAMDLKDITYNTADAGQVVFSHKTHLDKKSKKNPNLSCKVCHASSVGKNVRYTMADMEKGKSCGMCHNGSKAFSVAQCTGCHAVKEITYKVAETGPVVFSHTSHLKGRQCGACHNSIYKAGPNAKVTMAQMEKGKGCGACHNGKAAFAVADCAKCHPTKEVTYKVAGLGTVTFSHRFHTGVYSCGECHPKVYKPSRQNGKASMGDMEAGKSCGACHDTKIAFSVKGSCYKCH